jgi:hypothetical protein
MNRDKRPEQNRGDKRLWQRYHQFKIIPVPKSPDRVTDIQEKVFEIPAHKKQNEDRQPNAEPEFLAADATLHG